MQTFCRRQNLIRLVESPHCPPALKEEWQVLKKGISVECLDASTHSLLSNAGKRPRGSKKTKLDEDIVKAAIESIYSRMDCDASGRPLVNIANATLLHQYGPEDCIFTDFHTSHVHSLVYFHQPPSGDQTPADQLPAQIREIFELRWIFKGCAVTETFVAVHMYLPRFRLEDDPFKSYPDFRARVYHQRPSLQVQVIPITALHCHANHRPWDPSSVVIRAVDRVSLLSLTHSGQLTFLQEY